MMEGKTRKKYPPEKLNFRLGSEYIQNFYKYMDEHGGKKIDFVRDALDYWMSVEGKPSELQQQLEMLRSSQKHSDERLNDLNRLIEEKDARIRLLQERIEQQDAIIKKLLKNGDTQKNEDDHS